MGSNIIVYVVFNQKIAAKVPHLHCTCHKKLSRLNVYYLALYIMADTTLKMTKSNCEKSWSGTTRTINFGPHICDLCLWIDALLYSL